MAGQQNLKRRSCGTMKVHRRMLDTVPGYAEARQRIEEQAFRMTLGLSTARPGCTKIPVVVHVVWKTPDQNVSRAQIDSQIAVLNEDFRKRNADSANVPAPFAPLAGDARIEFELAGTDPDGNPSDGITRRETDVDSFGDDDSMKFTASGGQDAWPADRYLNIWVCQLSGGLLGYAQFPGGAAATDGVVVTHTGFGTTGTASPPFDKGRTTTHEIGHWLNLRHIWGDDGDGCSGSDFVSDTPNQGGPNLGKPAFPNVSCSNGPNGDMFMNYMDYVDDDTMVMFSEGQIVRMQATLDGSRSAMGASIPCGGPVPKPIPKDPPKELPKDPPKELPKDLPKDPPKDPPKELPKDPPKEAPKDPPKELPKDPPKEAPKDPPKELPKDPPKDGPKDGPFEPPKGIFEPPKSVFEPPKSVFEPPKSIYEPPKSVFEPPKSIYEPPKSVFEPPKSVYEPPKSVYEPPKSVYEPPKSVYEPPMEPQQPGGPVPPWGGGTPQPFVLATGADARAAVEATRAQAAAAYQPLLGQYAQLHQRGMLDAQGYAAWQQAWAAYQQLGGC